jgi:uncharacterized protein (DUF433 family)
MAEIVSTEDVLGGEPRIAESRVGVLDVYDLAAGGHAPPDVADQLDRTLAEVHAALAYYYEHPDEMRALRSDREEMARTLADRSLSPPHTV